MKTIAVLILLAASPSLWGGEHLSQPVKGQGTRVSLPIPNFILVADAPEKHAPSDPDRLAPDEEERLLRLALGDTYPLLPPELQRIAGKVAFVVNHSQADLTKTFMGWSAEDDSKYRYPDTVFYNPHGTASDSNPNGTIRVNVTEKFMKGLQLGFRLGEGDPKAREGLRRYYHQLFAHELLHAYQYHTGPIRDFSRFPNAIRNGLVDPHVMKEAKQKVEYEHDAFALQRKYEQKEPLEAFAHAIKSFADKNPALFESGGEYQLLSSKRKNPFVERYLLEDAASISLGRKFSPRGELIYDGQVVPADVVLRLKNLNDSLQAGEPAIDSSQVKSEIEVLRKQWSKFMSGENLEILRKAFPYTQEVERRFGSEMDRFEKLTR